MGLLKTIFGIILFYYAFKFIARLFFPFLLKTFVSKAQKNRQEQYSQKQGRQEKEGEVHVKSKKQSSSHQIEAEDVDFEEVD